jgi:chromosome partitioning related protein ParA
VNDYILIDTQGAKGNLQDAAVLAADILISPMPPEMAVIKELERGTLSMLSDLSVKISVKPPWACSKIL